MPDQFIVAGQPIDSAKLDFARAMRREMTASEVKLWAAIRGRKLNGLKFRRQQIIDGYIADFYCPSIGLVLEVDGPIHNSQSESDVHRDRVMMAKGLRVLRVPNARIELELDLVLREITEFAEQGSSIDSEN